MRGALDSSRHPHARGPRGRRLGAAVFAALLGLAGLACGNRAVDAKIEALGPEDPGVSPSEYHRPGQPCLLCHGEYGGASPPMSIAGTIFATPAGDGESPIPAEGALVSVTDSFGRVFQATTNCTGNFFFEKSQNPAFPLHAEIECKPGGGLGCSSTDFNDGCDRQVMTTRISRDGSCAGCHVGNRSQGSPGWVFCSLEQTSPPFQRPGPDCPGPDTISWGVGVAAGEGGATP